MKSARPQNAGTSAREQGHFTPGTLPSRCDTVTAAVLAAMLEGQELTGLDAVYGQHTTRLSAFILSLAREYGWHIARRRIATGTNDGRISWISAYSLPQATRIAAFDAGARQWVDEVKEARARLRKTAPKCKAKAARINAMRDIEARQMSLWGAM